MSDDADQLAVMLPQASVDSVPRRRRVAVAEALHLPRVNLENRWVRVLLLAPLLLTLLDYWVLDHIPIPGGVPHYSTLDFDRWLGGGTVPTAWLQQRVSFDPDALRWFDWVAFVTYASHFVVWPVLALTLWLVDQAAFRRFAAAFVPLTFAGYATYLLWPVAPPWMASAEGLMPAVQRLPLAAMTALGVPDAIASQFDGSSITAAVAGAVPSLHAAYPMLLALAFWNSQSWLRPLLVGYVPLMAVSLVYGGEHFVGDILVGWAYAIAAWGGVELVRTQLRRRRERTEARA